MHIINSTIYVLKKSQNSNGTAKTHYMHNIVIIIYHFLHDHTCLYNTVITLTCKTDRLPFKTSFAKFLNTSY